MPPDTTSETTESHKLQTMARLSPMGRALFKFVEFDADEELLLEVRKHPIGLVWIALLGFGISIVVFVVSAIFGIAVNNGVFDGLGVESTTIRNIALILGLVVSSLGILLTLVIMLLYVRNVIFITSEKIAEVVYVSLLNRRTIQLNIGKVEDVGVSQVGLFPRLFNYGSLLIETAGETKNPEFSYVPDPHKVSQVIIQAHEEYVQKYGN